MISVVIPAYNEEKYISKTLNALVKQITKQSFEVIVVDNHSTDKTRKIAASYKDKLKLEIITEKRKSRGAARRTGFEKALGEIILSTDGDTTVPSGWIEKMFSSFTIKDIAAVTGACRITDCSFVTNVLFKIHQQMVELQYRLTRNHWCLMGANFAIKKEAYMNSAGFNPSLNCREDADLSERVCKIGKILRVNTTVTVSGRRYKNGLIKGLAPYYRNRMKNKYLGAESLALGDIR